MTNTLDALTKQQKSSDAAMENLRGLVSLLLETPRLGTSWDKRKALLLKRAEALENLNRSMRTKIEIGPIERIRNEYSVMSAYHSKEAKKLCVEIPALVKELG
jgi:hypothetical protein